MGEHEPTGAEQEAGEEVKSSSPVTDADRAKPDTMPQFNMPKDAGEKDAVDMSDPYFAVNRVKGSGRTDMHGYSAGTDGYTRKPEPPAAHENRRSAYYEREGIPPKPTSFEQPRKGVWNRVKSFLGGQR